MEMEPEMETDIADATGWAVNPDEHLEPEKSNAAAKREQGQEPNNVDKEKTEHRPGLALDTCMQASEIAEEIHTLMEYLASHPSKETNLLTSCPYLKCKPRPFLCSSQQNTLDEVRQIKLYMSMYFNTRLFSSDTRMQMTKVYLFFSQFGTETHMATSNMSIQMCKSKTNTREATKLTTECFRVNKSWNKTDTNKDATRFMQPLRWTPAYWEKTLHAMVRHLGKTAFFFFFFSFFYIFCFWNEMAWR